MKYIQSEKTKFQ